MWEDESQLVWLYHDLSLKNRKLSHAVQKVKENRSSIKKYLQFICTLLEKFANSYVPRILVLNPIRLIASCFFPKCKLKTHKQTLLGK